MFIIYIIQIYNMKNITLRKDLTTQKSREQIYRKFMERGEKDLSWFENYI